MLPLSQTWTNSEQQTITGPAVSGGGAHVLVVRMEGGHYEYTEDNVRVSWTHMS